MADKALSLQDQFLNSIRRSKTPATIFLVKGVKLQGIVTWYDPFSLLLRRDGQRSSLQARHCDDNAAANARHLDLGQPAAAEGGSPAFCRICFSLRVRRAETIRSSCQWRDAAGLVAGYDQFSCSSNAAGGEAGDKHAFRDAARPYAHAGRSVAGRRS